MPSMPNMPRPARCFAAALVLVTNAACSAGAADALRPAALPDRPDRLAACSVEGPPTVVATKVSVPRSAGHDPAVVEVDPDRSLRAWTEGSLETGLDVHVVTLGRDGQPIGVPLTLEHDGSALGEPAVALTPSGRGVVTFVDSSDHGFRLLAVAVSCSPAGDPRPAPTWAMDTRAPAPRGEP
jgi:hypothetical protein